MAAVNPSAIITCIEQVERSTLPDKQKLVQALYAVLQGAQGQGGAAVAGSAPTFKAATDNGIKAINQAISYFTGEGKDDPNAQLIAGRLKQILIQENIKSIKNSSSSAKSKKGMIDQLQSEHDDIDAKLKKKSGVKKSVPEFDLAREAVRKNSDSEIEKALQLLALDKLEEGVIKKQSSEPSEFDTARDLIIKSNAVESIKKSQIEALNRLEAHEIEKAQEESLPEEVKKNIEVLTEGTERIIRKSATPDEAADAIKELLLLAIEGDGGLEKAGHGTQTAPIQDTSTWDSRGAIKRLYSWAGGDQGKKYVNWSKFGQGFLYHDESAPDKIESYKYPVGDIVNGKLVINRDALTAAAQRIEQSKGISAAEPSQMKATLREYYQKLGIDAPPSLKS